MLGLVILFFIGLYLLISLLVVLFSAYLARKHGRRGWVWGLVAAFVMYNLVFWDWIPTVAMHKYYCDTEAGFWVYKTPEQWAKENPGVLDTLEPYPKPKWNSFEMNGGAVDQYNDRFGSWSKRTSNLDGLMIDRWEGGIVDIKAKRFLVYEVRFLSGPRGAGAVWKSWLKRDSCDDELIRKEVRLTNTFIDQLKFLRRNPNVEH